MNRHKPSSARFFVSGVLQLFLAAALIGQTAKPAATSTLEDLLIPAPSLAGNMLGDPTTQQVFVYLPPSYGTQPSRRFPTLYLLHGYSSRPAAWVKGEYQEMHLQAEMDSLIAKGIAKEMIVVVPNGRNAYLGSFYSNSVVSGNWEDFVYRDVVQYVDGKYRTLARSSSRGIAGHSMGGYGAFMLAMKHPDVFGAVYSMSPCCFGFEGDLSAENPSWARAAKINSSNIFSSTPASLDDFFTVAMVAISVAFSPNKDKGPVYIDVPFIDKQGKPVPNEPAYSNYRAKMPLYLIERYRTNLSQLRGIILDVGEIDEFTHIRRGTAKVSAELSQREIPHSFEIYKGGDHGNKIRERFSNKVVPFFSAVLEK